MIKTLIVGASEYSHRYSYMAAHMLKDYGLEFEMIGKRGGELLGKPILRIQDEPSFKNIHTVTLYINPHNQKAYYDYLLNIKPERIIFNPGTENYELSSIAEKHNIEVNEACTLVMLRSGLYAPGNIHIKQ